MVTNNRNERGGEVGIWSQKAFLRRWHLSWDLKDKKKSEVKVGSTFRENEIGKTKVLRWKWTWCVLETERWQCNWIIVNKGNVGWHKTNVWKVLIPMVSSSGLLMHLKWEPVSISCIKQKCWRNSGTKENLSLWRHYVCILTKMLRTCLPHFSN